MPFIMHYELHVSPAAEGFFSVEHDKAVLCKKNPDIVPNPAMPKHGKCNNAVQ